MKHPLSLKDFRQSLKAPISKEQMAATIKDRNAEGAASKAEAKNYAKAQAQFLPAKQG